MKQNKIINSSKSIIDQEIEKIIKAAYQKGVEEGQKKLLEDLERGAIVTIQGSSNVIKMVKGYDKQS